jgi:hypothetical protein
MNDKLRQFEQESKLEIFGLGAKRHIWEAALEKYAELIVRECAEVAYKRSVHSGPSDILKHFGVDE